MTAWTSPLEMASDTPLRIWRPSTLARRSLISKSANFLSALLRNVCAVVRRFSHPCGARHLGTEQSLVHLLLVEARKARAGGHVLDRAVAVADREPTIAELDDLGHVTVLRSEPRELADSRCAAISPRVAWPRVLRKARMVSRLESTHPILGVFQQRC